MFSDSCPTNEAAGPEINQIIRISPKIQLGYNFFWGGAGPVFTIRFENTHRLVLEDKKFVKTQLSAVLLLLKSLKVPVEMLVSGEAFAS